MPPIPRKRIVCRYRIRKVDNLYWATAYDQGNERYPEVDFTNEDREAAREVARTRINNSYTHLKVKSDGDGTNDGDRVVDRQYDNDGNSHNNDTKE